MGKNRKGTAAAGPHSKKTGDMKSMMAQLQKKSLVQSNPKLAVLVLVVMYFCIDYLMMDVAAEPSAGMKVLFVMLAPSMLYSYYVSDWHRGLFPKGGTDMPKFVKGRKKYAIAGWAVATVIGILMLIAVPYGVPKVFPMLAEKYYGSQLLMMLYIAPVMEEIIFRYLLYDRWLRVKWGPVWGLLASILIFVVCHPVTNMHGMVIYWVPTVLFFMVYHEFGLYGAILMHMIYNMMAI